MMRKSSKRSKPTKIASFFRWIRLIFVIKASISNFSLLSTLGYTSREPEITGSCWLLWIDITSRLSCHRFAFGLSCATSLPRLVNAPVNVSSPPPSPQPRGLGGNRHLLFLMRSNAPLCGNILLCLIPALCWIIVKIDSYVLIRFAHPKVNYFTLQFP